MKTLAVSIKILLLASLFFFWNCDEKNDPPNPPDTGETGMTGETEQTEDTPVADFTDTIRFASFNMSLFRESEGDLASELVSGSGAATRRVAEIIQRVRPDFLPLMEFDFDEAGESLRLFQENYLEVAQNGSDTIQYPYAYVVPSNTGVLSEVDINDDGNINLPNDAYGFGTFPGQYAFAMLSKFPLDEADARTFQEFKWQDMPNAKLPENSSGESYYTQDALDVFRLSSKNHIDMPIVFPDGRSIHALMMHPTPPVFDGVEDRNGLRNHDEIRLFADYISNEDYLIDDKGVAGGLASDASFVIMGDLNADPVDGDSADEAILQLINHPKVNSTVTTGNHIPSSEGGAQHNQSAGDSGDPAHDTSFFGLRIDYVLPSTDLEVIDSGVFWPNTNDPLSYLTEGQASSDHLLVWVDLKFKD